MAKQCTIVKAIPINLQDDDMPLEFVTETGLKALRDDTSLSDDTRLTLEIMAQHPKGLTEREANVLVDTAIDLYGGNTTAALEAFKLGEVKIVFDDGSGQ
jgi:hypothetical protein